jgi:replicative DNA helicase
MSRALRVIEGESDTAAAPAALVSVEAEQVVLGCLLQFDTAKLWGLVQACGVRAGAFTEEGRRVAFTRIGDLVARGMAEVDVLVLRQELIERGELDAVGGAEGLVAMTPQVGTTAKLRFHAEHMKWLWDLRHCMKLAAELRLAAETPAETREKWVESVSKIGSRLITLGRRETHRLVADHAEEVTARALAEASGTLDRTRWVESSLANFNKLLKPYNSGIQDDGLVLVGGGSGTGKSVWLRQEAYFCLKQGKSVLFISRETGTQGVLAMMASAEVGVDLNNLARELPDRMERFRVELERMRRDWADRLLFIVQQEPATQLTTVEDLVSHVRAHVHRHGPPHLICVDYLQLFETAKRQNSREQTVAAVSHALQALQRELRCVVMVAAQLNEAGLQEMRTVKRDENGKVIHRLPKPGDLRESQAMYHDADRVLFLYKPPVDCRDQDQTESKVARPEVWIYQEKRRSGGVNWVRCWFEKRFTRFVELTAAENIEAEQARGSEAARSAPPASEGARPPRKGEMAKGGAR